MPELGLFTPTNPVTYANPLQAAAAATQGAVTASGQCDTLTPVTEPPPELPAKQVMRAADWAKAGKVKYGSRFEATICSATFFQKPPPPGKQVVVGTQPPADLFVDTKTGRLLVRTASGLLVEEEVSCLQGFGRGEYKVYRLDGTVLCTIASSQGHVPDPKLPPANYGDPTTPFGRGFNLPVGGGGGGGGGPHLNIGGVDVGGLINTILGGGGGADLSSLAPAIAAVALAALGIKGSLDVIPPGLAAGFAPGFAGLASAFDAIAPGVGSRLMLALDGHADKTGQQGRDIAAATVGAVVPVLGPAFAELIRQGPELLAELTNEYKKTVDRLIASMLNLFRDDIEAHAPVHPGNVDQVAAAALRAALTAGSVAQLAGMGLELLHPLKQMGVQQAIGVLAEFAGFSEIARPYFGATLRYGIGLPAEHRAAAHFRTVLPPLETVRELAAIGRMDPNKYIERLQLAGYPDPYPAVLNDIRFTPPPARFIANLLDGSEADRGWLADQFRRLGFSPTNIDRAARAAELKATAPGRGRLVSAVLDSYKAGRLEDAELDAGLDGAGLSRTHKGYYLRVAQLERRGVRMEAIATEVLLQYRNQVVGEATARQELVALGFTDDEVNVRMTVGALKLGRKQVQDEEKAIEAEVRALKSKGLALALRQLRAGFLSPTHFRVVGAGMGYAPAFLDTVAGVALLQGVPKTTAAEPAIGLGAAEEARARIAELVAQEVQLKRTTRLEALATLRGLGLPNDLASIIVELAEAIGGPSFTAGDYGLPGGAKFGGSFVQIGEAVLGGLGTVSSPAGLVLEVLRSLGLPTRDRAALTSLIRDLRDLFRI